MLRDSGFKVDEINNALKRINDIDFLEATLKKSNSIFVDPFGYMWMLHKIHKNLSFEERIKIIEEEMK